MRKRPFFVDLILGAAGGAAGTWLMDLATTALYEREGKSVQKRENAARGDKTAYQIAAEKLVALAGRGVEDDLRDEIGSSIHWSLGVGAGVAYGALRNVIPQLALGSGVVYGAAFWLLMDEAALTALGLTPAPRTFPWQTHARGLVGHLALGAAIESVFDIADAFTLDPPAVSMFRLNLGSRRRAGRAFPAPARRRHRSAAGR